MYCRGLIYPSRSLSTEKLRSQPFLHLIFLLIPKKIKVVNTIKSSVKSAILSVLSGFSTFAHNTIITTVKLKKNYYQS